MNALVLSWQWRGDLEAKLGERPASSAKDLRNIHEILQSSRKRQHVFDTTQLSEILSVMRMVFLVLSLQQDSPGGIPPQQASCGNLMHAGGNWEQNLAHDLAAHGFDQFRISAYRDLPTYANEPLEGVAIFGFGQCRHGDRRCFAFPC